MDTTTFPYHHTAIYDIDKDYHHNFKHGPFFFGPIPKRKMPTQEKFIDFLGQKVASKIGIPAGPLLNGKWCSLAASLGFDIVTYKTIRSKEHPCHQHPNVIHVNTNGQLHDGRLHETLHKITGDHHNMEKLAITNSFGIPCMDNDYVIEDIQKTQATLRQGQAMIVSILGTHREGIDFTDDVVTTALLAKRGGAKIIEVNYSCPNLKTGQGSIYQDPETVKEISKALVSAIGDIPLIIKVGYYTDIEIMKKVFKAAADAGVRAICGINTIGMKVIKKDGTPALGPNRIKSGICGSPIHDAAVEWVRHAVHINKTHGYEFTILATGGVTVPNQFNNFLNAGADIAMSATGFMWDPYLATRYHQLHD